MAPIAVITIALGPDLEATVASQGVERRLALPLARVLGQLQNQLLEFAASPEEPPAPQEQETNVPASEVKAGEVLSS